MMKTGLVSVTFRPLAPRAIVDLVARAGLDGIEWGGDVHVPHGDLGRAGEVRRMTADAGLAVAAYGSYYKVGETSGTPAFDAVLDTARALGATYIRVWAGAKGSAAADAEQRRRVAADALRIADLAAKAGMRLGFEFHQGTLTDTNESARQFAAEAAHPNIVFGWQPPHGLAEADRVNGLEMLLPRLGHVHVHWWSTGANGALAQSPLAEAKEPWRRYLRIAAAAPGDRFALLEFVKGNTPEQFLQDAATLKELLRVVVG